MGCGVSRGPQVPLYTNEFAPPCDELLGIELPYPETFPPSGVVANENGIFFDDREHIKQCQIVHIREVIVYTENYISGIELIYYIDGGVKSLKHCSSKPSKKIALAIQVHDSINSCDITFQDNKIYSLRLQTLLGKSLDAISSSGIGKNKARLHYNIEKRAIVAFKGKINEYLEGLAAYTWKMREKLRK
jgi:hypothetical protein